MSDSDKPYKLEGVATENHTSDDRLPTEPFPCPACGQLLGPSCKVCVACHHVIDPAEILRPGAFPPVERPPRKELQPVRFPWRIFLLVFVISVTAETLLKPYVSPLKDQLILGGVQILCSFWVLFDASQKRLPKPQRWALGTLLLWIVIFPWYLERRRRPQDPCPFIEGPVKRLTLAVLFVLLVVLFYVVFRSSPPS